MTTELFLDTKGTCFLCLQEPQNDIENVMSEVNLRNICRYFKIHSPSILRKALKQNKLEEEEKEVPFQKEKCEFSVTMCSTCSILTRKLTNLINQLEMINNLLTYQLQVFHRTINGAEDDYPEVGDQLQRRQLQRLMALRSSSEMEINLVEILRTGIIKKCSIKVKDAVTSSLPQVLLERLKSGIWKEAFSPREDYENPIETGVVPPTDSSLESSSLQDTLFLPPLHPYLPGTGSKPEMLQDPLSDQFTPAEQDIPPVPWETSSHKKIILEMCRKHSIIVLKKRQCSLCSYSTSSEGAPQLIRLHLLTIHPEILFSSQRPPHLDKLVFNESCRRLLSNETFHAKQRGGMSNERLSYLCEYCDRKFKCPSNFRYHLLSEHFKIMQGNLSAGNFETVTVTSPSNLEGHLEAKILQKIRPSTSHSSMEADDNNQSDNPVTFILPDKVDEKITGKKKSFQKKNTWICNVAEGGCGKFFSHLGGLTGHKMRHCRVLGRKEKWTCAIQDGGCGQVFARKYGLHRHQQNFCSRRNKSETPVESEIDKTEPNDNLSVKMECTVEDVVITKVEMLSNLDS